VTAADWRALIEAYLDGRLSAEAFMRRFMDAWRAGGERPRAVEALQSHVEAFEADVLEAGEDGAVNDDELRQAAQRGLANLAEESDAPVSAQQTFDRTRAREDIRRFSFQATGCLGIGCIIALVWVALGVLQINYVIVELQLVFGTGAPIIAFGAGLVLAFVPIIGNVLAFLGATHQGWPTWLAAIVFFAAPAVTIISGWTRWRRYQR
jgi:hypothetical protein